MTVTSSSGHRPPPGSLSSSDASAMDSPKQSTDSQLAKTTTTQEYPPTRVAVPILAAIFLAAFLVSLDRLIIGTAIPAITNDFNSLSDVGWYASGYLLPMAGFQLFTGRVYTFYSPKWTFLGCICLFELGSLICGVAPSSIAFIVGRAVAGLGSSGIFSGAITLVVYVLPLQKRPAVMGLMGAVFGVSSVIGPLLGGAFTDTISWRWCFYINLPFGGITIALILFFLKLDFKPPQQVSWKQKINRLDPIGTSLFVPSIVCLLLALQNGGTVWAWSNWRVILCLTLFSIGVLGFIGVQFWRKENATIPPRFLTYRSVVGGTIYALFNGASMMTLVYYLPIWFQAIKGASAVKSGIDLLPMVLGLVLTSILAGFITKKTGYYVPQIWWSAIIVPIAAGLICTFETTTGHSKWIGYQALYGLGLGMGMQQPSMAVQTVLPRQDVAIGASLIFFSQTLGGSIFVSVANNLFINQLAEGLVAARIPGISASAVAKIGATDLRKMVPEAALPLVLTQYNIALRQAFFVAAGVAAAMWIGAALIEWRSIKKQQPGGSQPTNSTESPKSDQSQATDIEKQ